MPKKLKKEGDPEVHKDLKGFDIKINTFGELQSSFDMDKLNSFLDDNTDDKKIMDQSNEADDSEE